MPVFTMGVYGENFHLLPNSVEISIRVRLKRRNDRGEFELDRTNSKNNIAENSIIMGHETNNS